MTHVLTNADTVRTADTCLQEASPEARSEGAAERPTIGTENQQRGEGSELRLTQWQAPTQPSLHVSTGAKGFLDTLLALEPLMHCLPDDTVEPINIDFSNPHMKVDGQRSEMNTPDPFLVDMKVREAFPLGIDRQTIDDEFYGCEQAPTPNIVNGSAEIESPSISWNLAYKSRAT